MFSNKEISTFARNVRDLGGTSLFQYHDRIDRIASWCLCARKSTVVGHQPKSPLTKSKNVVKIANTVPVTFVSLQGRATHALACRMVVPTRPFPCRFIWVLVATAWRKSDR